MLRRNDIFSSIIIPTYLHEMENTCLKYFELESGKKFFKIFSIICGCGKRRLLDKIYSIPFKTQYKNAIHDHENRALQKTFDVSGEHKRQNCL